MIRFCTACGSRIERGEYRHCPACGRPLPVARGASPPAGGGPPAVEIRGLVRKFGQRTVLDQLDLIVAPGETVVVIGLSGSGKSVLFDHLLGFYKAQRGTVRLFGREPDPDDPPPGIGVVFQGSALLDELTVAGNIELAAGRRVDCASLLAQVDLDGGSAGKYPHELSGGMGRRVAVARALAVEPRLILLDEPTTGLDARSTLAVAGVLAALKERRPDSAMLVITHDYAFAARIADRVLFMENGRLEELLARDDLGAGADAGEWRETARRRMEQRFAAKAQGRSDADGGRSSATWRGAFAEPLAEGLALIAELPVLAARARLPWRRGLTAFRFGDMVLSAMPMIAASGVFAGLMMLVQIHDVLAGNGMEQALPVVLAGSFLREVGPLLGGVLLAARNTSGLTAEIGGKVLGRQIDALRIMRVPPEAWLLGPMLIASVLGQILLTWLMILSALLLSIPFLTLLNVARSRTVSAYAEALTVANILEPTVKAALFGLLIVLMAWRMGTGRKSGSGDLGRDTTAAVVWTCLGVVALDFVVSFVSRQF